MAKRLVRSTNDSMLGGVCGGLGTYFDADPNLIRLIFVVFAAITGVGVLVYLALWLILPEEGEGTSQPIADRVKEGADESSTAPSGSARRFARPPPRPTGRRRSRSGSS